MKFGEFSATTSLLKRASSQFDGGDVSFIIVAGAMEFFMIPGLALLYSGLTRRKSALSLMWVVSASNAVCIFQWYLWGYSLAFSPTATNGFIGNLANFGLLNVLGDPYPGTPLIPDLLYSFYQMEFACVTVGILVGGIAERGRVLPAMIFTFLWMTFVYCPLACWAWNVNGWGFKSGVLDFAGGGPVAIGSGVAGLAYAWVLGRRQEKELLNFRPHNMAMANLGTYILWFGWLGFNGGCAFGANLRAIMAIWNSMLSPAFGGIIWCILDYRLERKYSMSGFRSGSTVGLVAATPASGYIYPWASVAMGIVSGVVCNYAKRIKFVMGIDDALDLFAENAVGGIIGLLFNGIFASRSIIALDGININANGGWVDRNWELLFIQFGYVCATCGYTFVATAIIAKAIDMIPGLHLRTMPEGESAGLDEVEIGEFVNDYIEVRRHFYDESTLGNQKGDPATSDLFANRDKDESSNLQKHNHRLPLEDPMIQVIKEQNFKVVIELQPTPEGL
ncbi:ammonium transporter [Pisolithus marmoratus]|nr:ammonium transporter [Pisolithus marmoratus]